MHEARSSDAVPLPEANPSPTAVDHLDEALVELSQLDVVCGAQVPRLGPLHCDAELVSLLQWALLAAELVHALDRGDEGLDRGERMLVGGFEPDRFCSARRVFCSSAAAGAASA